MIKKLVYTLTISLTLHSIVYAQHGASTNTKDHGGIGKSTSTSLDTSVIERIVGVKGKASNGE